MAGATDGYSGKSLAAKLGVKDGTRIWGLNAPDGYRDLLGPLPEGATYVEDPAEADLLHAFAADRSTLAASALHLTSAPHQGAALWISWPKKSSARFVDLTEDGVRELLLPTGWVDVKVCAIDADWSGLKFLRRRT